MMMMMMIIMIIMIMIMIIIIIIIILNWNVAILCLEENVLSFCDVIVVWENGKWSPKIFTKLLLNFQLFQDLYSSS